MTRFTPRLRTTPNRCVTIAMQLVSSIALLSALTTFCSLSESSAAVGSSKRRTSGLRISARAMVTRCRWPPDSARPPSPTRVSSSRFNSLSGSMESPAFRNDFATSVRYSAL
mmetsp:Transcript_32328/g.58480  ORF Transcript_32328/g.58480 Transcript_32328/m.58480 type:complete len:112 (-) Transcript_32328:1940-2275(-)